MERGTITEPEVYSLFKERGIPTPEFTVFKRGEVPKWDKFPAYLKVVSREIVHKSDLGGVLRVESRKELLRAVKELSEKFKEVQEFIVVEELKGIEAFVGVKRDNSFLHAIGAGSGGILVELFKDAVFIPLSATREETLKKLKETKLFKLIEGFRNYKGNLNLFLDFLERLKEFLKENPQIEELDLNPTFISENFVAPADAKGFTSPLPKRREFERLEEELFRPKSVAVIGASNNPQKVGYALVRNLEKFKGKVFPVNPKYEEVLGFKCYPSILEVKEEVDCALIAVPPKAVLEVVEECGEKGVKLVVVITAGFKETGNEELERKLVERVKKYGMRLLGPNTLGFIVPPLNLNASFASVSPPQGEISFLSQSGALITAVIDRAVEEGIGFSEIISLGNQADIEITEAFELATRKEETKVILSYVEGIELGAELLNFLKRKPALFIKAGRSKAGKRAASSHTGSLAGDYKLFKDCVECKGGIVADSLEEAFELLLFLRAYGRVKGREVLIITNAGGPGTLTADYGETFGLELASIEPVKGELSAFLPPNWSKINPIDLIGDATSERYRKAFNALAKYRGWDFAVVIVTPQSMTDVPQIAQEIVRFREISNRPVVGCLMGGHSVRLGIEILKREGVPVYKEPLTAVKVISKSRE
ncbi:acetate--CoA ligase family protein [Thermovibrio sp.]